MNQEVVSGTGLKLVESDEYSESGRGVYPDGLYRMLLQYHERYKHLNIPFIITENGVSDETDLIRRPYLIEHLLAVYAAMIKVLSEFSFLVTPLVYISLNILDCRITLAYYLRRVFLYLAICFGLSLIIGSGLMVMVLNLGL